MDKLQELNNNIIYTKITSYLSQINNYTYITNAFVVLKAMLFMCSIMYFGYNNISTFLVFILSLQMQTKTSINCSETEKLHVYTQIIRFWCGSYMVSWIEHVLNIGPVINLVLLFFSYDKINMWIHENCSQYVYNKEHAKTYNITNTLYDSMVNCGIGLYLINHVVIDYIVKKYMGLIKAWFDLVKIGTTYLMVEYTKYRQHNFKLSGFDDNISDNISDNIGDIGINENDRPFLSTPTDTTDKKHNTPTIIFDGENLSNFVSTIPDTNTTTESFIKTTYTNDDENKLVDYRSDTEKNSKKDDLDVLDDDIIF